MYYLAIMHKSFTMTVVAKYTYVKSDGHERYPKITYTLRNTFFLYRK